MLNWSCFGIFHSYRVENWIKIFNWVESVIPSDTVTIQKFLELSKMNSSILNETVYAFIAFFPGN